MEFRNWQNVNERFGIAFTNYPDRPNQTIGYFFDCKYKFENICGVKCQNTGASYDVHAFDDWDENNSLALWGDVEDWTISAYDMKRVKQIFKSMQ